MERKDADRFKKIEDAVEKIVKNQDKMIEAQGKLIASYTDNIIWLRDLLTKLIEGR